MLPLDDDFPTTQGIVSYFTIPGVILSWQTNNIPMGL